MEDSKLINGLNYFSIFFAPIIFPLVVWFLSKNEKSKEKAKHALILHILPYGLLIIGGITIASTSIISNNFITTGFLTITLSVIWGIIEIALFIYNIVLGIREIKA